jgi:hypothetical protein
MLKEVSSTGEIVKAMQDMVAKYADDVDFALDWPIEQFFGLVSHMPYVVEPLELKRQILQRPSLTFGQGPIKACANKAICVASWCSRKGYPWQFVVSANNVDRPFSHVFCRAKIEGVVVPIDATYFWNVLGDEKSHAKTQSFDWSK